jgi:hypothetical protein
MDDFSNKIKGKNTCVSANSHEKYGVGLSGGKTFHF